MSNIIERWRAVLTSPGRVVVVIALALVLGWFVLAFLNMAVNVIGDL